MFARKRIQSSVRTKIKIKSFHLLSRERITNVINFFTAIFCYLKFISNLR